MENQSGAAATQIAAHHRREAKIELSHEEMQRRHQDMAFEFGDQPERVKEEAEERAYGVSRDAGEKIARSALTFARERNFERDAVADERALLTDALRRSMGGATLAQVRADFEERIKSGEFVEAQKQGSSPGWAFTTAEMIAYEQDTINTMRADQDQHPPLPPFGTPTVIPQPHPHYTYT